MPDSSLGQLGDWADEPIVIDADEFEAARSDPETRKLIEAANAYADMLIERGHCPKCLVINCEHMAGQALMGQSRVPVAPYVYVDFQAQIKLSRQDVIDAGGDVAQAVQNEIGHTGAVVLDIDAEEEGNA